MQNEIAVAFNIIVLPLLSAIVYYGVSYLVMLRKGQTDKLWNHALIGPLILVVGIITLTVGIFEGSISSMLDDAARDIGAGMVFSGSLVGMLGSREKLRTAAGSGKHPCSLPSPIQPTPLRIRAIFLEIGKNGQVFPYVEPSRRSSLTNSICRTAWQSLVGSVLTFFLN